MKRRNFIKLSAVSSVALSMPAYVRAQTERTIVYRGGIVLPVDAAFSQHTALAVRGNRVLGVGSNDDMAALAGSGAETIDLDGRTLLPGFIEPHLHLTLLAALSDAVDIGPFVFATFDEAVAGLRQAISDLPGPEAWLVGRQFDPSLLEPSRDLTTRELDELAPDRPVFILNASGHIAYVNSIAMNLVGYTNDSEPPAGTEFGRYDDGSLNGVLFGQAAFLPILFMNEDIANIMGTGFGPAVSRVGEMVAPHGISTMTDMAAGVVTGLSELEAIRGQYDGGAMKARVRSFIFDLGAIKLGDIDPNWGNDFVRASGWKIVSDGSNQGLTGRQRAPYFSELSLGLHYVEPEDLMLRVNEVARAGWQLAIHGNGDAAIDSILNSVEYTTRNGLDMKNKRTRIEHASIIHDDQFARMAELGVHPSFLINHVHYWGHAMRDNVFGPRKVELLDRCAAAENAGLTYTIHTDAPVSPLGTLHKIRVAIARDLWKEPETILAPQERVSVESAIRAVTANAAWQCNSEDVIGSLEEGKLADMVILEEDPRAVDPTTISDIKVSETWMDGNKVYEG
ncbi:amidohydrolase family protein [Ruegeria sp. HKCCD6228]|uniref:amidohydrolase n=1 Tax=unclassified Ruegeria TaxID=2625375 RepID=UPI001489DC63|nr:MULTISPECIES: amidohydrolase [unclassified Ruegeria]NOD97549.1 amidohydrolase family protein [Ruegeria sp. HKCCD6228]